MKQTDKNFCLCGIYIAMEEEQNFLKSKLYIILEGTKCCGEK